MADATNTPTPDGAAGQGTNTQAAPDGGAPAGDGHEVRNWDDAKRAIQQRDQYKTDLANLRKELGELKTKAEADALGKSKAEGNLQAVIDAQQAKIDTLGKELADASSKIEEAGRRDRRRIIADAVVGAASPEHHETVRLMLSGLVDSGEINVNADDPVAEATKAVGLFTKRFPGLARKDVATPGAAPAGATPTVAAGTQWADLTPEQQRRFEADPEAFSKAFGRQSHATSDGKRKSAWG